MSKPEKTFKAGAVRASVFVNTIQRDGKTVAIRKVVLEVRYRDKSGEWKGTNSLSLNEVPKAITALQQAYEYLLEQGTGGGSNEQSDEAGASEFSPVQAEYRKSWAPKSISSPVSSY